MQPQFSKQARIVDGCEDGIGTPSSALSVRSTRASCQQENREATRARVCFGARRKGYAVPEELNTNRDSLAVLGALIAVGSQPNFAVRNSERAFHTYSDKGASLLHPVRYMLYEGVRTLHLGRNYSSHQHECHNFLLL